MLCTCQVYLSSLTVAGWQLAARCCPQRSRCQTAVGDLDCDQRTRIGRQAAGHTNLNPKRSASGRGLQGLNDSPDSELSCQNVDNNSPCGPCAKPDTYATASTPLLTAMASKSVQRRRRRQNPGSLAMSSTMLSMFSLMCHGLILPLLPCFHLLSRIITPSQESSTLGIGVCARCREHSSLLQAACVSQLTVGRQLVMLVCATATPRWVDKRTKVSNIQHSSLELALCRAPVMHTIDLCWLSFEWVCFYTL